MLDDSPNIKSSDVYLDKLSQVCGLLCLFNSLKNGVACEPEDDHYGRHLEVGSMEKLKVHYDKWSMEHQTRFVKVSLSTMSGSRSEAEFLLLYYFYHFCFLISEDNFFGLLKKIYLKFLIIVDIKYYISFSYMTMIRHLYNLLHDKHDKSDTHLNHWKILQCYQLYSLYGTLHACDYFVTAYLYFFIPLPFHKAPPPPTEI